MEIKTIIIGNNMCFDSVHAKMIVKSSMNLRIKCRYLKKNKETNKSIFEISNIEITDIDNLKELLSIRFNLENIEFKYIVKN